jgi:DNA-binding MarR family transcriptional regulator
MEGDRVHEIYREWTEERPDLDHSPLLVVGRVWRAAALINRAAEEQLAEFGLTRPEFEVLSVLRRTDQPRTPGQVTREMVSSGAATTKRLDRLERAGLISREACDRDGRVAYLRLTEAGRELIDKVVPEYLDRARAELAGLTAAQREKLGELLGRLMETLEGV